MTKKQMGDQLVSSFMPFTFHHNMNTTSRCLQLVPALSDLGGDSLKFPDFPLAQLVQADKACASVGRAGGQEKGRVLRCRVEAGLWRGCALVPALSVAWQMPRQTWSSALLQGWGV